MAMFRGRLIFEFSFLGDISFRDQAPAWSRRSSKLCFAEPLRAGWPGRCFERLGDAGTRG